jgi:cell division protein FtsA
VPLELGEGLSNEIESPEFATVAGLIRGIPGSGSRDNFISAKDKKQKGKFKINSLLKRVQEFFDEL